MSEYILSLDQGTTSSRALLFDRDGRIVSVSQREFRQITPREGWVEHDPREIRDSQYAVAREAIAAAGVTAKEIRALGITNQRETTLIWDRESGEPITNAIVWQCRRSAGICRELEKQGYFETIRRKTGLVLDPYFSGTKIKWILDKVPEARRRAEEGRLLFGTVDTWLIWNLTGGRVHGTDVTNASRTMLMNIETGSWDNELCEILDVPASLLPEIGMSSGLYGETDPEVFGRPIPIAGIAGDQQAALFGHQALDIGTAKNTYGTGCFMLMNVGDTPKTSEGGLLSTVAWGIDDRITYALEGSVFMAGAVIQWLRDDLGLIGSAEESETRAREVGDTAGVYLVPAFQGLGTPWWDSEARGTITGLTRAAKSGHIVRAALESIAYRSRDVLDVMVSDSEIPMGTLRVDGGASRNDFLMQFQCDILGVPVVRPRSVETTARGAAYLAGLATGFWKGTGELAGLDSTDRTFEPRMGTEDRDALYAGWREAVRRSLGSC